MYPFKDYDAVVQECRQIIEDRCAKGRNEFAPFYETRCHGAADCLGEIWQRVTRILGAEKAQDWQTYREDARDLVNEAIHLLMFFDKEHPHDKPSEHPPVHGPQRASLR